MQCQLKESAGGLRRIYSPATGFACCRSRIGASRKASGFTLVEVVMAIAIVALVFAGIIKAYIQTGQRLEWTGYSLAAQSLAIETVEQARSSLWDPAQTPQVNEITNLSLNNWTYTTSTNGSYWSGFCTNILDVPYESSNNFVMATNWVKIQMITVSNYANVQVEVLQVQTAWPFKLRANNLYFTNTVTTIIAPDNRAPSTF
jgi:prepilin-type N-terminal cleavage/methylation domain-containing protein